MRAISLWQPWATFIALGLKQYETRSWKPSPSAIGQPLLIHAAKRKMTAEEIQFVIDLRSKFGSIIPHPKESNFPLGALVAKAKLNRVLDSDHAFKIIPSALELELGNYEPNRFAWHLSDLEKLEPIPFKGSQGFFIVPDEVMK